ncbi:MAG: GGDEF domain-containing protein [Acidimicrobiia bacterium]|nr:GGDEF domain-containing protein [Acidimicrobiia bacterium]
MSDTGTDRTARDPDVAATAQDEEAARAVVVSMFHRALALSVVLMGTVCVVAGLLAHQLFPNVEAGAGTALITAAFLVAIVVPVSVVLEHRVVLHRAISLRARTLAREREMRRAAEQRELEARLSRGFEMADTQADAVRVIRRAMELMLPDRPSELLLADNSHAHLERVIHAAPNGRSAACPVQSPSGCVAARRSQPVSFPSGEDLASCPHLRGRPEGDVSACCVPVSIMGRSVGVLHSTGPAGSEVDPDVVERLQVLANQAGSRLGLLRVMEETSLQATTDELTGLLNRRSMDDRLGALYAARHGFALALCGIDSFEDLHRDRGTEAADRVLRAFAGILRAELRPDDLLGRRNGGEFVIALPDADVEETVAVFERIRERVSVRPDDGEGPHVTMSCGVVTSADALDVADLMARAESALMTAHESGHNRVVAGTVLPELSETGAVDETSEAEGVP